MKGFRLPEWMKNVLIIGLSCSALYLFTLSPLYQNSPLKDWTVLFLDHTQKTDGAAEQDGQRIDENSEHAKRSFLKVPVKIATILPHRAEKRKIFFEK